MKAADLSHCNVLGRVGRDLQPMRLTNGQFFDPAGNAIVAPSEWQPATQQQIEAELRRRGAVAVQFGDAA